MTSLVDALRGADVPGEDPRFPHAPAGWSPAAAVETARAEGLELAEEHWEALQGLQEYFGRHEDGIVNLRELHDALDEKFHQRGGIRHLYQIFPSGPVAQGCRIAGLKAPAGAIDNGFGSVA